MIKETKEFVDGLNQLLNSGAQAAADGNINFMDITHFIDDIPAAQAAVKDLQITKELRAASNAEMDNLTAGIQGKLTAFKADDAYDIAAIQKGILSVVRFVARKGYEQGLEDAAAKAQVGRKE